MEKDFYASLHRYGKDQFHLQALLEGKYVGTPKLLPLFEHLYEKYLSSSPQSTYLIPKKIHQIWLGSEIPATYSSYVQTWATAAGWEYRLWTDLEAEEILTHNHDLYQLGKNYGEKSDILRLEILYQEGGLYVDVDTECLNIHFFDHLHRTLDFYAGFEPLEHRWLGISTAVLGCAPKHPLMQKLIFELKSHFLANENQWAVIKTGPKYVTNVIEEFIQNESQSKFCLFPSPYFSPASGKDIKNESYQPFKESASIHYWTGSWIYNGCKTEWVS